MMTVGLEEHTEDSHQAHPFQRSVFHDYQVSEQEFCFGDLCESNCNDFMHFGEMQVLMILRWIEYANYNFGMNTFAT